MPKGQCTVITPDITMTRPPNEHWRQWLYPVLVLFVTISWLVYMTLADRWTLFADLWPISLTMVAGSFVAGATPGGGAAVSLPVFTKILKIPATDAAHFGLMIQAVGMMMASVMILVKRVPVLPKVIIWTTVGGFYGIVMGTYWMIIPDPFPKILFTFVVTAFGIALIISRWVINLPPQNALPEWSSRRAAQFVLIGFIGGLFASSTGSALDMVTFMVLTLAFGINEKIGTPTSVIIMALNSVIGFFLHAVISQDIGVAWNYWLVAVPIVIIGAPFGAFCASIFKRETIIILMLVLIAGELVTTIWLVPFSAVAIVIATIAALTCAIIFYAMIRYRLRMAR